jgi:predicted nucleotidyltransferase
MSIKSSNSGGKMVPEEVMDEVKTRLVENFHPRRIILFGSQAREKADDRSDVDLLVVCPIQGSRRALMVAMDRALKGLPIARDILVLTPEEFERDRHIPGTVARPAWREGRILYEAP